MVVVLGNERGSEEGGDCAVDCVDAENSSASFIISAAASVADEAGTFGLRCF
jgi:hypothetical protein